MPVIEHPIHPMTQKPADYKYGCFNVPARGDGYWAHPWAATGGKWVPFRMTHGCAYDMSSSDTACDGCFKAKGA